MQDAHRAAESGERWDDVRIFLAIARERSLGLAGKRLRLDTSTVSRRLRALEENMGARLFERTRQGLVPTRTAEQMMPAAEAIEASHARLTRVASEIETRISGNVRLSVPPGMADAFVAPLLVKLRERHPELTIELETSMRALDLTRHEADLAIRGTQLRGADLVITKLLHARSIVAGSAELARRRGKLREWSDAPWIVWDRDLASFAPSLWFAKYARGAPVALRTSHMGAQLRAAETGLGVLIVPEPYLATHALVPVKFASKLIASASKLPEDDLWLVGHRATRDTPRIAALWEFLTEELRGLASR